MTILVFTNKQNGLNNCQQQNKEEKVDDTTYFVCKQILWLGFPGKSKTSILSLGFLYVSMRPLKISRDLKDLTDHYRNQPDIIQRKSIRDMVVEGLLKSCFHIIVEIAKQFFLGLFFSDPSNCNTRSVHMAQVCKIFSDAGTQHASL